MRRAIFVLFLIFMLAGMAGLTAGLALYQFAPFQPGQPYYWLQDLAEHSLFAITLEPVAHAHLSLDLLDRRIVDLQKAAGLQAQNDALSALVGALDSTLSAVAQAPEQAGAELRRRTPGHCGRPDSAAFPPGSLRKQLRDRPGPAHGSNPYRHGGCDRRTRRAAARQGRLTTHGDLP
jgi:hypothetical protein